MGSQLLSQTAAVIGDWFTAAAIQRSNIHLIVPPHKEGLDWAHSDRRQPQSHLGCGHKNYLQRSVRRRFPAVVRALQKV